MKSLNSKVVLFIIGISCISIPVLFAIYQSAQQSLIETNKLLLNYAHDVIYRADKTGEQIENNIKILKVDTKQNPCLANYIDIMRALGISSSTIQALGYVKNNTLVCSSLGSQQLNWNLGPEDVMAPSGASIRFNVQLPNTNMPFVVIEKNHFAAIIHKEQVIETAFFNQEIALGVFSLTNQHLFSARGFLDPKWFTQLNNKNQATFLDKGYAVALVPSKRYRIAAVAASPFSFLNKNTIKTALILVPVSILAGLILMYLIIYWIRQQTSPQAKLKAALKHNEFYLVYQPVFDVRTNRCVGAEALVRWKRVTGECIPPDEFIPLAEKNGLIRQITQRVLDLVATEAKNLFINYPHFHLAINVSAADLHSGAIVDSLRTLVLTTKASADNLIIEATERKIMDLDILKQTLHAIHQLHIKVAIDDFGTGYSNLSYLEALELDYLKIDKSFVDAIGTGASTSQVIVHIIEMAKSLNLHIIAEGVESEEQVKFMLDNGVQFAQGWYFSKPTSLNNVLLLLQ
jgi:sensor c-di-GMP phosphodiesterase-like protein